jgi:tetratricopeptide (TPR) repeat protein
MASSRSAATRRIPGPDPLARAIALERDRDLTGALDAYETALRWAPNDPDILARLAALAGRLEMHDAAARLWEQVSLLDPERLEALEGRARAWRELGLYEAAIALLRQALVGHPQEAQLWNGLGVTLMQAGRAGEAITFLDEAARLDPRPTAAVYNRGGARFDLGDLEGAEADFAQALRRAREPGEAAAIRFAAAALSLARGDLAAGWDAYETRHSPHLPSAVMFDGSGRRWAPGAALAGKHLLLIGEQGLGDEIMFANLIPDVLRALGPDGRLSLAVEPRLVDLFARSFPAAEVSAHVTEVGRPRLRRSAPGLDPRRPADLWAPAASMTRALRRSVADFPAEAGYLRPDPAKVAHWRAWLGEGPPAVGLSWRSGKMLGDRRRQYPSALAWGPVLETPGVRFVNVQYGECAAELAAFRAGCGCEILEPPGLDIRDDIDGLAALCAALDLTLCVANATGALAGACGLPAVLLSPPAAWPRLGTETLPWYPRARLLTAPAFDAWAPTMAQAAALVADLAHASA